MFEFYCPYCKLWINDTVHRQHHHNDIDEPDERRDYRVRSLGVVYDDEEEYEEALTANPRNLPCPMCDAQNVLTPADVARGYRCDQCADYIERGW
jgi:ribosomal protein L44E